MENAVQKYIGIDHCDPRSRPSHSGIDSGQFPKPKKHLPKRADLLSSIYARRYMHFA